MSSNIDFFTPVTFSCNFTQSDAAKDAVKLLFDTTVKPVPKRIVRNGPALIVFWEDGTKTVVKCHDEDFDAEKGLAMALARKMWGRSRTVAMLKKVEEQ